MTGYTSEVLVYNRALSYIESCDVLCYLDSKWGSNAGNSCPTSTYCP
jgi:hypothetical protein